MGGWALALAVSCDYAYVAVPRVGLQVIRIFSASPIQAADEKPTSPRMSLHEAVGRGNVEQVKANLHSGCDLSARHNDYGTPLSHAAKRGDVEIVEMLLSAGAEVDAMDKEGRTLLANWLLIEKEVHKVLLAHGANPNVWDQHGLTPLHHEALAGDADMVRLLLARGADVNARDKRFGATPLHGAAGRGHKHVAELLLARNADINARAGDGATPLSLAVRKGHHDTAELIRKKGGKE